MPNGLPFPNNMNTFAVEMTGTGTIHRVKKAPPKEKVSLDRPMKARDNFLFGGDPEFFIVNEKGEIVPGTPDLIPGTKTSPHRVKKGTIQLDGVAAEINPDPAHTFEEWSDNIDVVVKELKKLLPKGWDLSTKSSHVFDSKVFDAIPDECKVLGCLPDFNAWTMEVNPVPELPNPYLRCIGGHLHIGWTKGLDVTDTQHVYACADLAKQLDWFLAYWALNHDTDVERRKIYGKGGSCRIKDYGMEYRTLSSFWVLNPVLRLDVWNRMQAAINQMTGYYMPDRVPSKLNRLLVEDINFGEKANHLDKTVQYPISSIDSSYARF